MPPLAATMSPEYVTCIHTHTGTCAYTVYTHRHTHTRKYTCIHYVYIEVDTGRHIHTQACIKIQRLLYTHIQVNIYCYINTHIQDLYRHINVGIQADIVSPVGTHLLVESH